MEIETEKEHQNYLFENIFSNLSLLQIEEIKKDFKQNLFIDLNDQSTIQEVLQHLELRDYYKIIINFLAKNNLYNLLIKFSAHCSAYEINEETPRKIQKISNNKKYDYLNLKINPFEFQYYLAQNGINGVNNIICLRTGAGKTLISAIICKHWYLKYKKENRLNEFKVAFIVPTRHLAEQQCNAFKVAFHENSNILQSVDEKKTPEKIAEYFKSYSIIFITAKKLFNTVEKSLLNIHDFKILVFDECHHTSGILIRNLVLISLLISFFHLDLHPYSEIMKLYFKEKSTMLKLVSSAPIIIGLTASLGIGKGSIFEHLVKFCANLDCKHVTHLKEKSFLQELKENVPSPFSDNILAVPYSSALLKIQTIIRQKVVTIENEAGIERPQALYFKIGLPEYENFIVKARMDAESSENRIETIACKYLYELHGLFNRIDDFTVELCIMKANEFLESTNVDKPLEIEEFCRSEYFNLITTINSMIHEIGENEKLKCLTNTIIENHKSNSKGKFFSVYNSLS